MASLPTSDNDSNPLFREVVPQLRPFQREAVEFATQGKLYARQWTHENVSSNSHRIDAKLLGKGRILLADEMGCGKSITALAIMAYYAAEWPLLIICPASFRKSSSQLLMKDGRRSAGVLS